MSNKRIFANVNVTGGNSISAANAVFTNATISNIMLPNLATIANIVTNNLNYGISNVFSGSFSASNNVSSPTNVTGLSFPNVTAFSAKISVSINGPNLIEYFTVEGMLTSTGWQLYMISEGDTSGVIFSITAGGQIQYTSTNQAGYTSSFFRYTVTEINTSGTYPYLFNNTAGNFSVNTIQLNNTALVAAGSSTGALYSLGGVAINQNLQVYNTSNSVAVGSGGSLTVLGGGSISNDLYIGGGLNVISNSNTIGNVYTTGGNVGVGTTAPAYTVDVPGNINVSGTVSPLFNGTGTMNRNRIINGDMRIDQTNTGAGAGGLSGNFLTYGVQPTYFNSVDRFVVSSPNVGALTAKQLTLSASDITTIGNFNTATAIGLVPNDTAIYLPLDGSVSDSSGNNVTSTTAGTMQYVQGPVCSNTTSGALYLANEGNVVASPTYASNYVLVPYTQTNNSVTVSFWMCCTKLPLSGSSSPAGFTNSGRTNGGFGVLINYLSATSGSLCGTYNSVANTPPYTITTNSWYHVTVTYVPSTSYSFYVNGSLIGSVTSSVPSSFNTGPTGAANSYLIIGDRQNSVNTAFPFAGFIDDLRVYNRALSPTEIAALATNVGTGIAPSATSFATQLKFDNTTSDAQATLPSPTVTGSAVYTPVSKTGTAALDLTANTAGSNPATNYLTYQLSSGSYNFPITLSGWFNATVSSGTQVIVSIGNNSAVSSLAMEFFVGSGNLSAYIVVGSISYGFTLFSSITIGTWYHVCITANAGSYANAYVNGTLVNMQSITSGSLSTAAYGGSGSVNQLRVGAQTGTGNSWGFKGFVDDVRVYNRVLTTQEVAGLYSSSQYASYSLFQQTIDSTSLSDLGWGTSAAQAVTASMWLKNNSSSAQQFSISANNDGSGMIAWLQFENALPYSDTSRFLNTYSHSSVISLSSSTYKVGSSALDVTANTIGSNAVTYIDYNVPMYLQTPFTVSLWLNANTPTGSTYQVPFCLSSGVLSGVGIASTEIVIPSSGQMYVDVEMNGSTVYSTPQSSSTAISANTWYHVCYTVSSTSLIFYINGVAVNTTALPAGGIFGNSGSSNAPITLLRIGTQTVTAYPFKGYLDDVRIYNRVLSPVQINQLYLNNATTTTLSTYLTPRSVVYNTPLIPANSWQKVAFTIPGDSTGNWSDSGLTLSLALGASSLYNTSNVAASAGNYYYVWNSTPYYMGSNIQPYGVSSSSLLASVANSVYITGLQLEKGNTATLFETRNITNETLMSNGKFTITGTIVQTVFAKTNSDTAIPTNSTWTATAITASITPKYSTSTLLVTSNIMMRVAASSSYAGIAFQIRRDTVADTNTVGSNSNSMGMRYVQTTSDLYSKISISDTFKTGSTTATTMTVYGYNANWGTSPVVGGGNSWGRSEIIIYEIA
jgi:Concanavalin A-like lectin/glucanases superfamily